MLNLKYYFNLYVREIGVDIIVFLIKRIFDERKCGGCLFRGKKSYVKLKISFLVF